MEPLDAQTPRIKETTPAAAGQPATARKPALLIMAPWFLPAYSGGAPRLFDDLLRNVTGFDVTVVADRSNASAEDLARFDEEAPHRRGYRVRRIRDFNLHLTSQMRPVQLVQALSFYRRGLRECRTCLADVQPDIIVSENSYPTGWLFNRLAFKGPLVHFVHGEELAQRRGAEKRWFKHEQIRSLRQVDHIICVSRFTAERVAESVHWDRISVLPNAVDVERFVPPADRDALRRQLGWEGHTVLLTVARLVERKGLDHVLMALRDARDLPENWLYVIGGKGPLEDRLREMVREMGLQDRVRFLGFVPDENLPGLYGAADLFIEPNREINGDTEGFGIVFLEANACGVPVIGGLAGGTADAIEHGITGLRVDGDDPAAVRRALSSLMNDSGRRATMGCAGRERAVRNFSVPALAGRFEGILHSVLEAHAAGRSG